MRLYSDFTTGNCLIEFHNTCCEFTPGAVVNLLLYVYTLQQLNINHTLYSLKPRSVSNHIDRKAIVRLHYKQLVLVSTISCLSNQVY